MPTNRIAKTMHNIRLFVLKINVAETLLALTLILNVGLVAASIASSSYLDLVVAGTGYDGWCDLKTSGWGNHCFADYWTPNHFAMLKNPWVDPAWNYPPAVMVIPYIFFSLGNLVHNPQVGMVSYLSAMALALMVPAWWASRNQKFLMRVLVLCITGVSTVPALFALDRGNSVGFVVPALMLFLIGVTRNNGRLTTWAIILATFVKPQFAFLLAVPIMLSRWKVLVFSCVGIVISQMLPYLIWPAEFPQTIIQSLNNMMKYGGQPDLSTNFPPNVSIVSALYELFLPIPESGIPTYIQNHQLNVTVGVLAVFIGGFWLLRNYLSPAIISVFMVVFASIFVPVTWAYYLVSALPVVALLIRDPNTEFVPGRRDKVLRGIGDGERFSTLRHKLAFISLAIAGALTLSKVMIPAVSSTEPYPINSWELTSAFWIISGGLFITSQIPEAFVKGFAWRKKPI